MKLRCWDSEVFKRAVSWGGVPDLDVPLNEGERIVGAETVVDAYGYWCVRVWISDLAVIEGRA